jgi:hypothetical protein
MLLFLISSHQQSLLFLFESLSLVFQEFLLASAYQVELKVV